MSDDFVRLTSEEFIGRCIPKAGYVIIERDNVPKKMGLIHLANETLEKGGKWAATGIIREISPIPPESEHDKLLWGLYNVGDRVGFDATIPFMAPLPAFWRIENIDNKPDSSVTLHVADILGWVMNSKEEKKEKMKRIVAFVDEYLGIDDSSLK